MMHFTQSSPRPDSYEIMVAAYAMASGLGDVERAAAAYSREPGTALADLQRICEETRQEALELADAMWQIHQLLSTLGNGPSLKLAPFEKMLEEMRESEARLDHDMAQHELIREIMMPLRRATAKARANVSNVVLLLRQVKGDQQPFKGKADPEALRELAHVSTRLLEERFG